MVIPSYSLETRPASFSFVICVHFAVINIIESTINPGINQNLLLISNHVFKFHDLHDERAN